MGPSGSLGAILMLSGVRPALPGSAMNSAGKKRCLATRPLQHTTLQSFANLPHACRIRIA